MNKANWIIPAAVGFAVLFPATALALPLGMNGSCSGCHYGQTSSGTPNPLPDVSLDVPKFSNLAPGEEVTFAFTVKANWSGAIAAGFNASYTDDLLNAEHLAPVDERTKVLDIVVNSMQESPGNHSISHRVAQPLDANRETTFQAKFIAPAEPGVYEILLQTVTSDSMDGIQEMSAETNDPTRDDRIFFSVGCDMSLVFGDGDEDGFGDYFKKLGTCDLASELGTFSAVPGDCDDAEAFAFPGSQACGFRDYDCDGTLDSLTFHPDADGDGSPDAPGFEFPDPENPLECERPGKVAMFEQPMTFDCDPTNPAVFPGAPEIPNGIDDNCDTQIDEATAPVPGVPAPPPVVEPTPVPGGMTPPVQPPAVGAPAVPVTPAVPGTPAVPVTPGVAVPGQPVDPTVGVPTVPVFVPPPAIETESGFGCSVSGSSKSPLSLLAALFGGAAMILLRRRR